MKAEFSRLTFDRRKHYAGVLHQQGRVGLDADWNEWVEIVLHRLRTQALDTIGGCGQPKHAPGFQLTVTSPNTTAPSLRLSPGRLYAGGLQAELEEATLYAEQIDWPFPDKALWNTRFPGVAWPGLDFSAMTVGSPRRDLVYAEVWLRHETALNDEARRAQATTGGPATWGRRPRVGNLMREQALGGPDTCTRVKLVAQVKHWQLTAGLADCNQACAALATARPRDTTGDLQVGIPLIAAVVAPCTQPLTGGYGGAEHRTYRVEIHEPGAAGVATYKWSLENGAFTVRVDPGLAALSAVANNTDIMILSKGNDQTTELKAGEWVELCGEDTELGVWRNRLAQLVNNPVAQPDGTYKVRLTRDVIVPRAPFLRRWSADTAPVTLGAATGLDAGSGVTITFSARTGVAVPYFHALDYWMWAARTDIRDIEPRALREAPQPPRGIERFYCCLAIVQWTKTGTTFNGTVTACPIEFPPLTELPQGEGGCCCTITVGDGTKSHGQFTDIAAAIAALPATGGIVCIQQGDYRINVPIEINRNDVIIHGCGPSTKIVAPDGAFLLDTNDRMVFTGLSIAIERGAAIRARDVNGLKVLQNEIRAPEPDLYALTVQGEAIDIMDNTVLGAGIEIVGRSERVRVRRNLITRSRLRGIGLGNEGGGTGTFPIANVVIADNVIARTRLEAIGVPRRYIGVDGVPDEFLLDDLTIDTNEMRQCGWEGDGNADALVGRGVVSLALAEHLDIHNNIIEDNGRDFYMSGIYLLAVAAVKIHDNRVLRNGLAGNKNLRAGILIDMVVPALERKTTGTIGDDGWPALTIRDNVVAADLAPALVVRGFGHMAITGNDLTARGPFPDAAITGRTVSIQNLGKTTIGKTPHGGGHDDDLFFETKPTGELNPLLTGSILFAQNRCELIARQTDERDVSVHIRTNDDLCVSTNHLACFAAAGSTLGSNALLLGATSRIEHNRFVETPLSTEFSCRARGVLMTALGNQGTHCLVFDGTADEAIGFNLVEPAFAAKCKEVTKVVKREGDIPVAIGPDRSIEEVTLAVELEKVMLKLADKEYEVVRAEVEDLIRLRMKAVAKGLEDESLPAARRARKEARVRQFEDLAEVIAVDRARDERLPVAEPGTVVIQGRVTDRDGDPLKGYRLKVTDRAGKFARRLSTESTDEEGYFRLTVRAKEFPELTDGLLFVKVTDPKGREVFAPAAPVAVKDGATATMSVTAPVKGKPLRR